MEVSLFIHLLAIGIWAGCVATEVVCEFTQQHSKSGENFIARLHWNIDRFVEIPAIIVALITGVMLLENAPSEPMLTLKITAGVAAVCLNAIAAFTVYKRYGCYLANDMAGYHKYDLLHERIGVGCVLSILTAIVAGGYYLTVGAA
ncbi:MAG: hypothetical protein RPR40_12025 [Bermanella sp.]